MTHCYRTVIRNNVGWYLIMTMNEQNKDNLNDPRIRKLFEDKNFVFLSSLMKDGSPHVTPTWVDIENGNILINTAIGRIKQKNISRDPRVALAIADQNNPYDMVTIRGKVIEQISGDPAEEHIDKLAKKYIDKDKYPGRSPGEKRILLKIKPERIFHMHQ
ncbi:MAG TPA: PPOX class F420-dependent oxidoreductase [Nitrososphaeraceae archaeon]